MTSQNVKGINQAKACIDGIKFITKYLHTSSKHKNNGLNELKSITSTMFFLVVSLRFLADKVETNFIEEFQLILPKGDSNHKFLETLPVEWTHIELFQHSINLQVVFGKVNLGNSPWLLFNFRFMEYREDYCQMISHDKFYHRVKMCIRYSQEVEHLPNIACTIIECTYSISILQSEIIQEFRIMFWKNIDHQFVTIVRMPSVPTVGWQNTPLLGSAKQTEYSVSGISARIVYPSQNNHNGQTEIHAGAQFENNDL